MSIGHMYFLTFKKLLVFIHALKKAMTIILKCASEFFFSLSVKISNKTNPNADYDSFSVSVSCYPYLTEAVSLARNGEYRLSSHLLVFFQ